MREQRENERQLQLNTNRKGGGRNDKVESRAMTQKKKRERS